MKVSFRLHFDNDEKNWAKVIIFDSKESMYSYNQRTNKKFGLVEGNDYKAMFKPVKIINIDGEKESIDNFIGTFLFTADQLGSGLVAHECGHAAFHYWRIKNNDKPILNMEQEEQMLYTLAFLVACFWRNYFEYEKEIDAVREYGANILLSVQQKA